MDFEEPLVSLEKSSDASASPADTSRRPRAWARFALALTLSVVCMSMLVVADESLPPSLDEAWSLRWLRALAVHPVRGTFALALLILGLRTLLGRRDHD